MVNAIGFTREIVFRLDPKELIKDEFESYTGDYQFPVIQTSVTRRDITNTFNDGSGEREQTVGVITREVKVKAFRLFVNLFSFAECPIVAHSIEDSDFTYLQKVNQHDASFPGCEIQILFYRNDRVETLAQTKVLNKRPGYYINLLRFLTDKDYYHLQSGSELRIVIKNIGYGLPQMNDTLTVFAEIEEIGYLMPTQQSSGNGVIQFPDNLNVTLTGATTGNGNNGGETLTPKIKLVYTGENTINRLIIAQTFYANENDVIDISQYEKRYYAVQNDVVIELTDLLQLGAGYIFLALESKQANNFFVGMVDPWSVDIQPFGSCYLLPVKLTDSSVGMEGWYWGWAIKVLNTTTSVEIGFYENYQ